ncbi:family 16 glycoside hydrolase [Aquimarina algicola]|uniref:DUF1080 domain-containing protein n=1 Tax=Aquimarina algicola TaxID=2589995 RepID=A0A504JLC3_9FLAO|nr:family 16 glycoside hydrolase [Aquimarina algicola]TPN87371.1 DUF1080 domain-containing protein [Aquimarina algicola]
MKSILKITILLSISVIRLSYGQIQLKEEKITPEELVTWQTFDKGKSYIRDNELIVEETEGADGYFLISPKTYAKDFVLKYKVKPISKSTVLITLFSAIQDEKSEQFGLPKETATPREVWEWRTKMKHYNLTINNASHGNKPFFFKNISPHFRGFYKSLPNNIIGVGHWYDVEIGKEGNRLWFKLNDKTYFDVEDCNPFEGGRLLFRISGSTGEKVIFAKAAFKDIVISYK